MSWWDTSGFTNLASQALKNAQKRIDKVLDIEDDSSKKKGQQPSSKAAEKVETKIQDEPPRDGDFWSGWLGGTGVNKSNEDTTSDSHSSWSIPWNVKSSFSEKGGETSSVKPIAGAAETPKAAIEEVDHFQTVSDSRLDGQVFHSGTGLVLSADETTEEKLDHSSLGVSYSPTGANIHDTNAEKDNLITSDSFTTEWQDFPLEDDVPKPPETSDYKGPQDLNKIISLSDSIYHEQSHGSEQTYAKSNIFANVKAQGMHEANANGNENAFRGHIHVPLEDINSEPEKYSSQSNTLEWLLSTQTATDSSSEIESDSINAINLSQKEHYLVHSSDANAKQDDGSLKISSSSSFMAVSEDSVTETASSLYSAMTGSDIFPQGSSTPFGESDTESSEVPLSASGSTSDSSSSRLQLVRESQPTSTDMLEIKVSELGNVKDDCEAPTGKNQINLHDGADVSLPEPMLSSGYHKSQSDFMQEYVKIGTATSEGQNVPLESSTVFPGELLHSSIDPELGSSRTSSDIDLPGGGRASSTGSSDTSKFDSSIDTIVDRSVLDSQSDVDMMEKDHQFSLFGESSAGGSEIAAIDVSESALLDDSSQSLSSSYVKCMIEEAMEDSGKIEDCGSDNHSSGEKSESSKVDSELEKSIYSGHESSDEIETTTSSDIEIISAPTPNGDSKYHTPYDLSPLRISLQRSEQEQGHHRSDSQSSSSAHSKAGEIDRLSPERGEGTSWRDDDFHHHGLLAVREEGADNPSHPERLLKKLAEMAEVLQARENKLVQLSKENHQLMEDNNILRSQLQQSEDAREAETADLTALTQEFAARIGESEKKLQAVIKEREMLKQKLTAAEKELERRSANLDIESLLEEKKVQVDELLKEGEKLSKQQLQNSNIIKKLRSKEKENDTTITTQKKKLDEQAKELERLVTVLDSKEEMEKKQTEAINQLNAAVQRQEKDLNKLKSDLEDAQEKSRGLQVALDNSYKEIAELHRSNATQDSKALEAALSAETHVREELRAAMEREQQRFRQEREAFIMQADDLRLDMARLEKEHSRREDLLRQEIAHLQERLQQDEARSQDLTHSVTSATRPLLRQIENLQATYGAQSTAWERVEKNLTDRLAEAQTALAMAQEKERTANDHLIELSARVASLEATNSRVKQEKAQLAAQVESDRSKLEELQDVRNSTVAQLETSKQKLAQEMTQLKMDKVHLESQLNVERTRLENEKKKTIVLEEQLRQAERPQSSETPSPSPSMSVSRQESMAGSIYERHSPGTMSWSFHDDGESVSTLGGAKTSVYDSLRQSGAAIIVENLSSQLKMREGEISHMQSEISQLERTRESMARELVNLTNQNEELLEVKKSHEQLLEQFKELNNRYSAILQMYGEKEEEVQELRLDLQDVKEMYKSQIDALLAK